MLAIILMYAENVDIVDKRNVDLRIRCSAEVRRKFREFVIQNDFKNFEEALNWLLNYTPIPTPIISKAPVKTFIGTPVPARMR
jgi:hypothetical protein